MPLPPFLRWLTASPPTTSAASTAENEQRIAEQINPTAIASSPTQEDWYWGRLATGGEEDYYWRRLSDNWYMKDVIPLTSLKEYQPIYFSILSFNSRGNKEDSRNCLFAIPEL